MTVDTASENIVAPVKPEIPFLQKWRSFGTGLGIEVCQENLKVCLTVVRPNGIRVVDAIEVLRYRQRPAAEWGAEFQAFLVKNKATHLSATVVLPNTDCVCRFIALPGVANQDLEAAVKYQLDGLHPFAEEDAMHSFGRLEAPRQAALSLGISRKAVIEDYATLFDEAGIAVRSFLTPAAAIYSALRVLQPPPGDQFLAVHEVELGLLVYGETPTHPIYCVAMSGNEDRAVSIASSQIRLGEEALISSLAGVLPVADRQATGTVLSYAASLTGALPGQGLALNLLPSDRRKTSSPWRWVPTIVLMVLLMLLGAAFAFYQDYENQKLLTKLDAEIARQQPRLSNVRLLDTQAAASQKQLDFLATYSRSPQQDLDSFRELTRIMPMNSYVGRMEITPNEVNFGGEIDQSMELLKMLDSSLYFKESEFLAAPSRSDKGKEIFQIRTKRESPSVAVQGVVKAAVPVAPNQGARQ